MTGNQVRWLDATEQQAWRGFLTLHARIAARLNQDLQRRSGLSLSDYDILVQLTDVPDGRRRAYELCEALEWEKSRLSKQVSRMAARGLVVKERCEEDRRGSYVVLTPAGRRAIEDAAPAHVERVRQLMIDGLSRQEIGSLASAFGTLLDRIETSDGQ